MSSLSAADGATSWRVDWAWSLPLIIVTVIIHVFGLGLLHERVVHAVSRIIERRHLTRDVCCGHGYRSSADNNSARYRGRGLGCRLLAARRAPGIRSSILFSLGAMTTYGGSDLDLEERWRLMGAQALNGIILFGLTAAFLFSMIQEVWLARREPRHRH
jgi:hypothetical protein